MSRARIGVVVVAYNAASTLLHTLDRIPPEFLARCEDVIVLDDASTDLTFELAQRWASKSSARNVVVVRHEKNLGYGGNQKAAYALAQERGLDVVALLHGDGQYDPAYLPDLVDPVVAGEAEAVFGSRMMTKGGALRGGMPVYKWLGNKVLTRFENRMLGTSLTEFHSGYRAYRVSALARVPLQHNSDGFDFDTQIIVQLVDQGLRVAEVPIPTYYGDEICRVDGLAYARDVVKDVVEYRFAKLGFGTAPWVPADEGYQFKEGDGSSHAVLLDLLDGAPPARVLDLGCSGGLLAERLRGRGHHVTGVDVVAVPGVEERVDAFVQADLSRGLPDLGDARFDYVVAADVLEHLPRPLEVLQQLRSLLSPNGQVLISVPNVGHWYPRARVASGSFGYDRRGPLDDTHLRFFSRRTLRRMVARAGFDVLDEEHTGLPLGVVSPTECRGSRWLKRADAAAARVRPQLFAYQFVMRLTPHREGVQVLHF